MVSFRLSPEEFRRFDELRVARRIGSLSDLARTAMQNMAANSDGEDPLSHELRDLHTKIRSLAAELDRLTGLVDGRMSKGANSGS